MPGGAHPHSISHRLSASVTATSGTVVTLSGRAEAGGLLVHFVER